MGLPAINVLALFAGACGLELGIKRALPRARLVCAVEGEAYAAATLSARMGEGRLDQAPIWSDAATFDGGPWRGVVDLISGGFPCTDISIAGRRAGIEGPASGLWFEMARIIGEVGPNFVFVENVSALTVRGLDRVLGDLAESGFDAEWGTLRASDVGAPHRRERVFIFAWRVSNTDRDEILELAEQSGRLALPAQQRNAEPGHMGGPVEDAYGAIDQGEQHAGTGAARSTGAQLGDTESARREGPRIGSLRIQGAKPTCIGLGRWPPGPEDAAGWREVLAALNPSIEPAICRGADGMANRLDRLRMTGNGVVPVQAGAALSLLMARAGRAEQEGEA